MTATHSAPPLIDYLSPADIRHVKAAQLLLSRGRYQEAGRELDGVNPLISSGPTVLALRAEILLGEGKAEFARAVAHGAAKLYSASAWSYFAVALTETHAGDLEAAKEALGMAFAIDGKLRDVALKDPRLASFWRTFGP